MKKQDDDGWLLEAEIVGCCLTDPSLIVPVRESGSFVFSAPDTVMAWREITESLQAGQVPSLFSIRTVDPATVGLWIDRANPALFSTNLSLLRERAERRQFEHEHAVFKGVLSNQTTTSAGLRQAFSQWVDRVYGGRRETKSADVAAVVSDTHAAVELASQSGDHVVGVPYGYRLPDRWTHGMRPGMSVIGALPSVGKTQLACNVLYNLLTAKPDATGVIFSNEMGREMLGQIFIALRAGIPRTSILTGWVLKRDDLRQRYLDAVAWWRSMSKRLHIYAEREYTTVDAMVECRRLRPSLVVFDYIQIAGDDAGGASGDSRLRIHASIVSRNLRRLGRDCECPVLALSQLSRNVYPGKEPELHHLKESGNIEADAQQVIFLWRDKPDDNDPDAPQYGPVMHGKVAKCRDGQTGRFDLWFETETGRITEVANG